MEYSQTATLSPLTSVHLCSGDQHVMCEVSWIEQMLEGSAQSSKPFRVNAEH